MQGFSFILLPPGPLSTYRFYEDFGTWNYFTKLCLFDNCLFCYVTIMLLFDTNMLIGTMRNLKLMTSMPDKMKGIYKRKPGRTWSEIYKLIFGEQPCWYDYILPTKPKHNIL